jgi:hypothetical protein
MNKLIFVILSAAAFSLAACGRKETPTPVEAVGDVSQRIGYFASHGWEVEEISEKNIDIPAVFSEKYEEYALMQDKQGLPLRRYAGRAAKLFVYEVRNYSPNGMKMLAELLVCGNTAVASTVYSEDGGSLRMPVS